MAWWHISSEDGDLQEFFGKGMVIGFTVLFTMLLILAGGIEGGSSAHKLMAELGFVFALALVLGGR